MRHCSSSSERHPLAATPPVTSTHTCMCLPIPWPLCNPMPSHLATCCMAPAAPACCCKFWLRYQTATATTATCRRSGDGVGTLNSCLCMAVLAGRPLHMHATLPAHCWAMAAGACPNHSPAGTSHTHTHTTCATNPQGQDCCAGAQPPHPASPPPRDTHMLQA
jgi:hypothetical protein